jgi:hypothetical protein
MSATFKIRLSNSIPGSNGGFKVGGHLFKVTLAHVDIPVDSNQEFQLEFVLKWKIEKS